MYAVFQTGGKQYKVKKGDTVRVELLKGLKLGETKAFSEVLAAGEGAKLAIGKPFVDNATVSAEVVAIEKGPKIEILHKKRRKQFKRKVGHRQPYTRLLITELANGSDKDTLSATEKKAILGRVAAHPCSPQSSRNCMPQWQRRQDYQVK